MRVVPPGSPPECSPIDEKADIAMYEGKKTIITMGHSLGLAVVAEGVESHRQLAILRQQECDAIQGFCYSRPLPAEQFTALLKESPFLVK